MAKRSSQRAQRRAAKEKATTPTTKPAASWFRKTLSSKVGRLVFVTVPAAAVLAFGGFHWANQTREKYAEVPLQEEDRLILTHARENNPLFAADENKDRSDATRSPNRSFLQRVYPNSSYCVRCHTFDELDAKASRTLERAERRLIALFGEEALHTRANQSVFFFEPAFQIGQPNAAGSSGTLNVKFSLPAFVRYRGVNTATHELVHHLIYRPFQYVHEPWAYTTELLTDPGLLDAPEQLPTLGLAHGVSLLQRVLKLSQSKTMVSRPEEDKKSVKIFNQLRRNVFPADIRSASVRSLYRQAMQEYLRHDVFWDAASASLLHQYLVQDVLIAKRLAELKDPLFLKAKEDKETLRHVIGFFADRKRFFSDKSLTGASFDLFQEVASDLRQDIHHGVMQSGDNLPPSLAPLKGKTPEEIDALYYAALHSMFVGPDSSFKQEAIPPAVLEQHARFKAQALEGLLMQLASKLRETIGSTQTTEAQLEPYYQHRRKLVMFELARVRRLLSTKKFVE